MGIDVHALNFLRYTKKKKLLGNTLTIGRQGLHVDEAKVRSLLGAPMTYRNQKYCETLLLEYFGATIVDSIDVSDFEKATHIVDMNRPLPDHLRGQYDTVIDGGCLEHVFNVTQALKNCSLLCKVGGQILHILPANQSCGHGFWQFSPELFFSLYSEDNGYRETEVWVTNIADESNWYLAKKPAIGDRLLVSSTDVIYLLVRTVLERSDFSHENVQQSDYQYQWNKTKHSSFTISDVPIMRPRRFDRLKQAIRDNSVLYRLLLPLYRCLFYGLYCGKLESKNPNLAVFKVNSLV